VLPLSFSQRRLWFLNRLDSVGGVYNVPLVFRLSGELDVAALVAAVDDVVARHESLRTVVGEVAGVPCQVVLDGVGSVLSVVDCVGFDVDDLVRAHVGLGFDLSREIPVRGSLFVCDGFFVLALVVHHFAMDGLSVGPLLGDLRVAYGARSGGVVPGWVPLPVQYADFALWQREVLGDEAAYRPGSHDCCVRCRWHCRV
jgi:hypothetical protein